LGPAESRVDHGSARHFPYLASLLLADLGSDPGTHGFVPAHDRLRIDLPLMARPGRMRPVAAMPIALLSRRPKSAANESVAGDAVQAASVGSGYATSQPPFNRSADIADEISERGWSR
jgi:hypothetical protein